MSRLLLAASVATLLLAAASPAVAHSHSHGGSGNDRASFGSDITVAADETAGDVACAFCSVHLHGDAKGDVAVFLGSVIVDQGRTVSGDVAVFGGDVSVEDGASVGGDVALFGGDVNVSPEASIHGSRAIFPGRIWLLLPFAPLLVLIGIIWIIVWAVRRNRYQFPYYPNGRGF